MSRIAVYPCLIGKDVLDSLDAFYPDRYPNLETAITLPSKSNTIIVSEWLKEYPTIFQKDAQQFEKRVEEAIERFLDVIRDLEFPFAVDVEIPVVITLPTPETTWVRAKVTDLGPAPFRAVVDDDMLLADETDS